MIKHYQSIFELPGYILQSIALDLKHSDIPEEEQESLLNEAK